MTVSQGVIHIMKEDLVNLIFVNCTPGSILILNWHFMAAVIIMDREFLFLRDGDECVESLC